MADGASEGASQAGGARAGRPAPWAASLPALQQAADEAAEPRAWLGLARRLARLDAAGGVNLPGVETRIAVLGGATTDFLLDPLRLALRLTGVRPVFHVAPYGQIAREMLDPESGTQAFRPDLALVVNGPYDLPRWPDAFDDRRAVEALVDEACAALLDPARRLHERTGAEVVLSTLHDLPVTPQGNLGARLPGDVNAFLRRLNVALADRAPACVHLLDVAGLAARCGVERWLDLRYWYLARQPVSFACLPEYARAAAAVIAARRGRSRKCLVLDLDNTLWGGLVGEDGALGIELGEGSPVGECFKAFQHYVAGLKRRGVLLALCSKNDERFAREAFEKHPEMVLRWDDFVARRIDWGPKSAHLRSIAEELGLGLDALVFADDQPAERHEVRSALPEVAVPELGDDPAAYPRILDAGRWFEAVEVSEEDRRRTALYRQRAEGSAAAASATDLGAFLRSLEMKARIGPFDEPSFDRITQLTNKTNQFNLTARRVTRAEIESLAKEPQAVTRCVRLRDRFGDHGLVSVLFGRVDGERLTIEAWLMSCRVLGRGVEHALWNDVLALARGRGLREIDGLHRRTDRNGPVREHYARLGFVHVGTEDGTERWRRTVADAEDVETAVAREC